MWKPRRLTTLRAFTACYRDSKLKKKSNKEAYSVTGTHNFSVTYLCRYVVKQLRNSLMEGTFPYVITPLPPQQPIGPSRSWYIDPMRRTDSSACHWNYNKTINDPTAGAVVNVRLKKKIDMSAFRGKSISNAQTCRLRHLELGEHHFFLSYWFLAYVRQLCSVKC
jgi:hypothetical protein